MSQLMTLGASAPGGVCLAIPSYGAMSPVTVFALAASMRALTKEGIAHDLIILGGNCHVDDARNSIVREFLQGTCEYLMFIDSDLSWAPEDLVRMARSTRDVIAGIYPHKQDERTYPVRHLKREFLQAESDGALEVEGVPTGFLRISRAALLKMAEGAEQYYEQEKDTILTPKVFERTIDPETRLRFSGDYSWCRKWRALGGSIYIDPEIHFGHVGEKEWRGCYGAHLRELNNLPLRGVQLIRMGMETPHDLRQLHEEWGNSIWAAPVEMLEAAVTVTRGLPPGASVLELGTGLTTLCIAAANPQITVHSVEHDAGWLEKIRHRIAQLGLTNIELHFAPIVDRWYARDQIPRISADVVVIDGPPRWLADRKIALEHIDISGIVLLDDISDSWRERFHAADRTINEVGRFAIIAKAPLKQAA